MKHHFLLFVFSENYFSKVTIGFDLDQLKVQYRVIELHFAIFSSLIFTINLWNLSVEYYYCFSMIA